MSIEMVHLSDCTPAECYVYQYMATWVIKHKPYENRPTLIADALPAHEIFIVDFTETLYENRPKSRQCMGL